MFLLVLGVGAYIGLVYLPKLQSSSTTTYKTEAIIKEGILQPAKGDDYDYVISEGGVLTGVTTQKLDLSQYSGKKVRVTGQYSGTTLYADTVADVE